MNAEPRKPLLLTPEQYRKVQDLASQCAGSADGKTFAFNDTKFLAGVSEIVGRDLKPGSYEIKVSFRSPRIPDVYPDAVVAGMPLNWRDDQTGELPKAMDWYHAWAAGHRKDPPSGEAFELLREYLIYHIKAPCWQNVGAGQDPEMAEEVRGLVKKAEAIVTLEDFADYLDAAMDLGLDPF